MCRICNYNQVKDIDRALLSGVSAAALSRRYKFTASELQRHQDHLNQKMSLAAGRFHAGLHQMLFCKLNIVMEMTLTVIRKPCIMRIPSCSSRPAGNSPGSSISCIKWPTGFLWTRNSSTASWPHPSGMNRRMPSCRMPSRPCPKPGGPSSSTSSPPAPNLTPNLSRSRRREERCLIQTRR